MADVLGLDCRAYQLNSFVPGTGLYGTATELTSVTGVKISNSLATADVTRRGGGGYRQKVGTLAEGDVSFDIILDTADTFFDTLDAAFRDRSTIDIWFGQGEIGGPAAVSGTAGFLAEFAVTDFSEQQELEDAVRYSVTLSVSGNTITPGYYTTNANASVDGSTLTIVT